MSAPLHAPEGRVWRNTRRSSESQPLTSSSALCLRLPWLHSCPQEGARLGHYGSYLLDRRDWPVVMSMVRVLHDHLSVPVLCKIRLLQSEAETLKFCLELQAAGCACIAIHGRKRGSTKRRRVGAADLGAIARLRERLHIPLIANGNIRSWADARNNLLATQCQGVMSAEAILANPRLFAAAASSPTAAATAAAATASSEEKEDVATAAAEPSCIELAHEYLDYCTRYPAPPAHWIADHAHNICRAAIQANQWTDLKTKFKAIGRTSANASADAKQDDDSEAAAQVGDGEQAAAAATSSAASSSSSASAPSPTVLVHVSTAEALSAIRGILAELQERLLEVQRTGSAHVRLQRERRERRQAAQAEAQADALQAQAQADLDEEAKHDADDAYGLAGDWESDPA